MSATPSLLRKIRLPLETPKKLILSMFQVILSKNNILVQDIFLDEVGYLISKVTLDMLE